MRLVDVTVIVGPEQRRMLFAPAAVATVLDQPDGHCRLRLLDGTAWTVNESLEAVVAKIEGEREV